MLSVIQTHTVKNKRLAVFDSRQPCFGLFGAGEIHSVKSSTVYMQDSIEIFIDENNKKTTSCDRDDGQYQVNYENRQSFGSTGSGPDVTSASAITDFGYIVESRIYWRTLKPAKGTIIGFEFQVNDDQGSGLRDSIAKWNGKTNGPWASSENRGIIELQ